MKKLVILLALVPSLIIAQCNVEILDFNWNTYTATVAIDCDESIDELTLYLGNSNLDDIPPCGNFSQNINWPEYTFTFFNELGVTQDTITLNIFDAWNNIIANPYTIAECWTQLYDEGFFCDGGEVGIWQVNINELPEVAGSYITFDGLCPCDTITEIIYQTDTIIQYVDVIVYEYIYITDTIYETDTIVIYDCDEYQDPGIGFEGTGTTILDTTLTDCHTAYIPNVFTPNGDGVNDRWRVITRDCWQTFDLKVYNRWGNLVWWSFDPLEWWYGDVQDGVYTWKVVMVDGGIFINKTGHITVIK